MSRHLFTIAETKELLGLNQIKNAIFSDLFVAQLCQGINTGEYHSQIIVDQIRKIQNSEVSGLKEPRNFKGDILSEFMHSHWFETKFLPQNLMNYWKLDSEKSKKFHGLIKQCCVESGLNENDNITVEVTNLLAKKSLEICLREREDNNRLTGEWIIFYNKYGINIFLTLAFHTEKDEDIFLRMANNCQLEFPNLFSEEIIMRCRNAHSENNRHSTGVLGELSGKLSVWTS